MEHRDGIGEGYKTMKKMIQSELGREGGYWVDMRSRHWECVSGIYGTGEEGN